MKIIQDISKKKAKKLHLSHFKHVLLFVWDISPYHTNWKSSFYGSWQKLSKVDHTLWLLKIIDHIGRWRLISTYWTKSHPQIIPGRSWLSIFWSTFHLGLHRRWPRPPHLPGIAVGRLHWAESKVGFISLSDDHHTGCEAAWQEKWLWKADVGGKR